MELCDDANVFRLSQQALVMTLSYFALWHSQVVDVDLLLHLALEVNGIGHDCILVPLIRIRLD